MSSSSVLLGNIRLNENAKDTGKSSGQVILTNRYDSRLQRSSLYYLTHQRIRTIVKDPTISLARQAVVAPMIHTPWEYVAKEGAPADAVEHVRDMIEPIRDWFIQTAAYAALDFGWAPFEIIYELKNERTVIKEFKNLLPEFTQILVYIDTGRFAGFANEPIQIGSVIESVPILIPYAMNINFVVEGTDWYGISVSSILDEISTDWEDVNDAANRYDKKVAGATWVVYYPVGETMFNGTLTDNDDIARTLLNSLEASGTIAIPDEIQEYLDDSMDKETRGKWKVELIAAQGTMAASFVDRHKYLDNLKIRAFGIPERSILEAKFGTKADAETHADMALMTIDTKHRLLCDQVNEQALKPLLRMEYGEEYETAVCIKPAPIVDAQFQTVKEIYRLLIQSPETLKYEVQNVDVQSLRDQVGIPTVEGAENDFSDALNEPEPVPFGSESGEGRDDETNKGEDNGPEGDDE